VAVIRIAAALGRALARQHVRDLLDTRTDADLVAVSATVAGIRPRVEGGGVDICLVDADLADADALILAAQRSGVQLAVLVWNGDGTVAAKRLSLRRTQVHELVRDTAVSEVLEGLLPKPRRVAPPRPGAQRPETAAGGRPAWANRQDLLVIGSSTGGPDALAVVLGSLPPWFDVPILICQHMPPSFTELLAKSLDKVTHIRVGEAGEGTTFTRGQAWIAPGGAHMLVAAPGRLALNDDPPVNSCRPSVDVLFRSVAEVYGRRAVTVVLTGMGNDGAKGAEALHRCGSHVIAQDEASSVVWGMPGAVVAAGVADEVVPLNRITDVILNQFGVPAQAGAVAR
jgi:two-component system chemotaxis response regulator CheB